MYNQLMKLVIQIPCHNEQENVLGVLNAIPKNIDLSTKTGLSNAFRVGITNALKNKADILVNIDGDNQYDANDIEKLIKPILNNNADITIGARPIDKIKTFSPFKKCLQKFGSLIVKLVSKLDIKDAASGYRAFNKNALLHLNVFNNFTYTIETIIQAKYKNLRVQNVDIKVNEQKNRKSKLFKNNFDYIFKQAKNLIRFFIIYRPARFFSIIASLLFLIGFVLGLRFLYFYFTQDGSGHIQSLILCAIILTMSFVSAMLAIVGDLFSINRKILEEIQFEIRQNKYKK